MSLKEELISLQQKRQFNLNKIHDRQHFIHTNTKFRDVFTVKERRDGVSSQQREEAERIIQEAQKEISANDKKMEGLWKALGKQRLSLVNKVAPDLPKLREEAVAKIEEYRSFKSNLQDLSEQIKKQSSAFRKASEEYKNTEGLTTLMQMDSEKQKLIQLHVQLKTLQEREEAITIEIRQTAVAYRRAAQQGAKVIVEKMLPLLTELTTYFEELELLGDYAHIVGPTTMFTVGNYADKAGRTHFKQLVKKIKDL